mgnify:CR=1 FL=1
MTEFVLYGIIILALATIYVGLKKPGRLLFDKVCDTFLVFSCLHALYVVIIRLVFDSSGITDAGSPFILGYGAFFYMGLISLKNKAHSVALCSTDPFYDRVYSCYER